MPAGPETQFQAPGIQATGYTPTHYAPIGINVPTGAGQLWAGVGKTALDAASQLNSTAQMMQQSPLNPAVQAQMDYNVNQYDTASDRIDELNRTAAGRMTMGTGPGGLATVPAAGMDIDPMIRMALRSAKAGGGGGGGGGGKGGGSTTSPTPVTKPSSGGESYGSSAAVVGAAPPAPATQPKTEYTPGDELTDGKSASTTDDYLLRMRAERKALGLDTSDAAQEGTPASMTFVNPATGNVEAYKTVLPAQPQRGSIWSPQRPSPAAPPPAPGQPPEQPAQSQTPAAATQADQAAMQQWQNQNAHPVMSSQDALGWMKNQTTLAQDATYLPMGGPNGSPAYAFHMKGGGMNIVPVSQMLQKGAGPIVAAQNTSAVISQTDQMQQNGQQPGGMPSGTGAGAPQPVAGTPGPTPMPSGTGLAAAQGQPGPIGPPPAPTTPMPSGTGLAAAQGAPGPPPAPGAYNAAAYQMPQGPTVTQAGDVNPALMAGGTDEQALAAAQQSPGPQITDPTDFNANIHPKSKDELSSMKKDPDLGDYAGFQWRQNRNIGTVYAVQPSTEPFHELRWNAGRNQWDNYWVENGQLMKQVQDARANTPFMKMLSDTDIENMSEEDLKDTLDRAVHLAKTGGDASDQNSLQIRGGMNQSKSLGRHIAMLEAAKKEGIDPKLFNTGAQESSEEAAKREGMLPPAGQEYPAYKTSLLPTTDPNAGLGDIISKGVLPDPLQIGDPYKIGGPQFHGIEWGGPSASWDLGWAALHGARTTRTGGQVSSLADRLRAETKYFTNQMAQTPVKYSSEGAPERGSVPISAGYQGAGVSARVPLPADLSNLKEIQGISEGTNIDDMISRAKSLKSKIDGDTADSIDRATRMGWRTPPQFKKAYAALTSHKNIDDPDNEFVDKNGNARMPDHYKYPPGMVSNVSAGGGPNTQVADEMKRFYGNGGPPVHQIANDDDYDKLASGQLYKGPDGVTRMK